MNPHGKKWPLRFACHSHTVQSIAVRHGWRTAARYTNLRDVRRFSHLGFLDIDWRKYNYRLHLAAAFATTPCLTVARDILRVTSLNRVLDEAYRLAEHACGVIVVPKSRGLIEGLRERIPLPFILGYSVPTRYGHTSLPAHAFSGPVHLLGGRPDRQRRLAMELDIVSFDCNRFTLDASFGDYFDGLRFRPHPEGGYERCIRESIKSINYIWQQYAPLSTLKHRPDCPLYAA